MDLKYPKRTDGSAMKDLTLTRKEDGTIEVSSHLTRGRAATIWFSLDGQPHVMWAVIPSYRNGLSDNDVLAALAA